MRIDALASGLTHKIMHAPLQAVINLNEKEKISRRI